MQYSFLDLIFILGLLFTILNFSNGCTFVEDAVGERKNIKKYTALVITTLNYWLTINLKALTDDAADSSPTNQLHHN